MKVYGPFLLRLGNRIEWATKDTILRPGEQGFELDTGKFKIGNGLTRWSELRYFVPEGSNTNEIILESHIMNQTPHPAYDEDILPLTILFENGLV